MPWRISDEDDLLADAGGEPEWVWHDETTPLDPNAEDATLLPPNAETDLNAGGQPSSLLPEEILDAEAATLLPGGETENDLGNTLNK